jgi:phospholipase D1/2
VEEASNKDPSARVSEETETVLTNGQTEGVSTPTEKVNGSAINDKGKKTRGESPFTKQEREEMEALLGDLCGHLG